MLLQQMIVRLCEDHEKSEGKNLISEFILVIFCQELVWGTHNRSREFTKRSVEACEFHIISLRMQVNIVLVFNARNLVMACTWCRASLTAYSNCDNHLSVSTSLLVFTLMVQILLHSI